MKRTPLFLTALILLLVRAGTACREGNGGQRVQFDTVPQQALQLPDTLNYEQRLLALANGDRSGRWPVQTALPLEGALLPFKRVVAFYGNFYSSQMGILGEAPALAMLQKLKQQCYEWELADTTTPVIPAIHYIAVTAQQSPFDGRYRLRMPAKEIEKAIALADSVKGIVFLDVQVGLSTLEKELPLLGTYLKRPNVHLGIDPEFSMKTGKRPGTSIGSFDAADVNFAAGFLASIVRTYELPPKILVIHRFTQNMLTNYQQIQTRPEVQFVINMDGFGSPQLKKNTYRQFVARQPVQFTGWKVFYKNDVVTGGRITTPAELLQLQPVPVYIQYQ